MDIQTDDKGTVQLSGHIDEFAEYKDLVAMPRPLRLSLRGIKSVNSQGFKLWVHFVKEIPEGQLELFDLPSCFVDLVNFVPEAASPSGNPSSIKSVMIPYSCLSCSHAGQASLSVSKLQIDGDLVTMPQLGCPKCKNKIVTEVYPDDYFVFLTIPAA